MKSLPEIDSRAIFNNMPGIYLILLTDLTIPEVLAAYAGTTMAMCNDIMGNTFFVEFKNQKI